MGERSRPSPRCQPWSKSIAGSRAGHAAGPAAARAQFGAGNGEHLNARVFQSGIGLHIAFITDNDTGSQRQCVVAVVPLFAFSDHRIEPGVDNTQLLDPDRRGRGIEKDISRS